ncbi:hypothetical protein [Chryseobacterium indoltheticum]
MMRELKTQKFSYSPGNDSPEKMANENCSTNESGSSDIWEKII